MSKKIIVGFFSVLAIMTLSYYTYCTDLKISTDLEQIEKDNKTVEVNVTISEMSGIDGINAYSGELIFNPKQLELVRIEGTNIWNEPSYNEKNAIEGKTKVVSTSNQFTKEYGTLFTAVFNKKSNNEVDEVKFSNIEVAAKVNEKTVKVNEDTELDKEKIIENELNYNANNNKKVKVIIIGAVIVICLLAICTFIFCRKNRRGGK